MTATARFAAVVLPLAATAFLSVSTAYADDIGDAITDATTHYKAGELSAAKGSLDLASQLVAQKIADALVAALPKPLMGWKAGMPDTNAGGGFGFSVTQATMTYTNGKGDSIDVAISADSPLMAQLVTMLSNPQMAALMGKIIPMGAQKAIQTKDGEVNMLINNHFVVDVTGGGTPDDKLNYAKAVNVAVLTAMK